jgi:hypothetical protein
VLLRFVVGGIEVTDDPASDPVHVSLDFAHVSMLRFCDERAELLASATPTDGAPPSVTNDERGERRLFAGRPGEGWRQVGGASFAADPVATTDRYLVSRGTGISVYSEDGNVLHEYKKGRFNWGPPSLSLSRGGSYLAWVRWKGDHQKLCVMDLADYTVTEYAHSLYRYAWLDDRRLVFLLGSAPRVLDAATGETERFLPDRYDDIAVAGDRVWLTRQFRDAVVTCRLDGSGVREVWNEERSFGDRLKRERRRVQSIVPLGDGSASLRLDVYHGPYTIVRREERWVGPLADGGTGWTPLLDCHQPEFGFLLPFEDAP